ncbi:MAG: IS21 family transposase [Ktedonobacteraceae bacterium]
MITVEDRESIRRAYYLDHKSKRQIAREQGHSRKTIDKAVDNLPPRPYQRSTAKPAPIFGPFQARADELLTESEHLPPKQRYTAHKIFEVLQTEGYQGSESRVRLHFTQWYKNHKAPAIFLPLEFEPGQDAQVDWGEAIAIIAGIRQTVNLFVMYLSHSRRRYVMAFPSQKQESFFYGHVCAFNHFGGVPWRISYDNLATAVRLGVEGKGRREQRTFVTFRSYYLFESHFCQPAAGWEKGGVEASVGWSRRNFMVPIPDVASFEELNLHLLNACLKDDQRCVSRQRSTIGHMWEQERPYLRRLPGFAYDCCATTSARLNPYSMVVYETNRYSVPVKRARQDVIVKAYPFHIDILDQTTLLARHPRCYEREQDIFEPTHYLPLLEQRPGAFEYAKPLKRWREGWPDSYHQMLRTLRETWPEGRGVQEFIRILRLHEEHPTALVQQAIEQALAYGSVHLDGVVYCLHHLISENVVPASKEVTDHLDVHAFGNQPIDLRQYEQLLRSSG